MALGDRTRRRAARTRVGIAAGLVVVVAAVLLVVLSSSKTTNTNAPGAFQTATPAPAESFDNSVGVVVHSGYGTTSYGQLNKVIAAIGRLGVHNVRDILAPNDPGEVQVLQAYAAKGAKSTLILGDQRAAQLLPALVAELRQLGPAADAVEGPNEPELHGDPQWAKNTRAYQQQIYTAIKGDPQLRHLTVLAPSIAQDDAWAKLGNIRPYIDAGNVHPYSGGQSPERTIDHRLMFAPLVSGNAPLWATETGFQTGVNAKNGQPGVAEPQAAILTVRMLLDYFGRGIRKSFDYELVDEKADPKQHDAEQHFGLLRSDFSPKPSYTAIQNLLTLVRDPGPAFQAKPFRYSIGGDQSGVSTQVLQKRDGTTLFALWQTADVWDIQSEQPVTVPTRKLTFYSSGPATKIETFVPTKSSQPDQTLTQADHVSISLGADPVIIAVKP